MPPAVRPSLRTAVLVVLALAVLTGACSRGEGSSEDAGDATTTSAPAPPTLTFTVTGTEHNGTAPPSPEVLAAVQQTLDAYLAQAVVAPLYSGQPAGDLSGVLSADALARVSTDPAARAGLVDEGVPAATTIVAERANVLLGSVAGPDAVPALVAARIDLALRASGPAVDLDIVRSGEFVLAPQPEGWRIDSFVVHTERDTRDA